MTAEEEAWFHGETRLAGEQPTPPVCPTCRTIDSPACSGAFHLIGEWKDGKQVAATPPVECPAKVILKILMPFVESFRLRPGSNEREFKFLGELLDNAASALSTPCPPCPTCAELTDSILRIAGMNAANIRMADRFTALRKIVIERDSLRKKVERLVDALRQIQWGNVSIDDGGDSDPLGGGILYEVCPLCDQSEARGHAPDCLVGMALAEHDKEQGGKAEE